MPTISRNSTSTICRTPQSTDTLIYERPDEKEWGFGPQVSEDGRYLVINVWQGTDVRNRIIYRDLQGGDFVELISDLEAAYIFIGNDEAVFYFRTNLDAPRGRLIAIDTTKPAKSNWRTLIPESQQVLESVKMVNDQFVAVYNRDAHHEIWRFGLDGKRLGEISLPTLGTITTNFEYIVSGKPSRPGAFLRVHLFSFPAEHLPL